MSTSCSSATTSTAATHQDGGVGRQVVDIRKIFPYRFVFCSRGTTSRRRSRPLGWHSHLYSDVDEIRRMAGPSFTHVHETGGAFGHLVSGGVATEGAQ